MGGAREKFWGRAQATFARADTVLDGAISTMLADHSAAGRLGSGATAKAAVRIFEETATVALDQVLAEAAKLIEHRGRQWDLALAGIAAALDTHLATAPDKRERATRLSGARESPAAMAALTALLEEMSARLRLRLSDFHSGWTAPVPKAWKDRHPTLFQVVLLVAGAIVALGGSYLAGALSLD
jgi:hypothetical protein